MDNKTFYNALSLSYFAGLTKSGSVTVYAKWEANKFSVGYILDGGTNHKDNPSSYTVNDSFTLKDPTKAAYTFNGWTGFGYTTPVKSITVPSGTKEGLVFTAHWDIILYNINYSMEEGTNHPSNPDVYTVEDSFVLQYPTRNGFIFTGWTFLVHTTPVKDFTIEKGSTGNIYLTANWSKNLDAYPLSVTAGTGGGWTINLAPFTNGQAVTAGTSITLTAVPDAGYSFDGWFVGSTKVSSSASYAFSMPSNNLTLEAHFTSTSTEGTPGLKYTPVNSSGSTVTEGSASHVGYAVSVGTATNLGHTVIVIPSIYNDKPVIEIAEHGFYDNYSGNNYVRTNKITSITIPDSITRIPCNQFSYTPDSFWASNVFSGCTSLTSFSTNNASVPTGDGLCIVDNLGNIVKENGVTLVIKIGVEHILNFAIYFITSIIIPDSVTRIGAGAMSGCFSISNISIPTSVTIIDTGAFGGCTSLVSITILNNVTNIGDCAFTHCSSLASITIPDSVISIGHDAFYYCTALASITIPNSVTSIRDRAFANCSMLSSINTTNASISNGDGLYVIDAYGNVVKDNGIAVVIKLDSSHTLNFAGGAIVNIVISDDVTSIGDYAFYKCSSLASITIPNGVTSIGSNAFGHCSSLTSTTIPNSVTSIRDSAFVGCKSLTFVAIPNSVISIGNDAFYYCTALASITIPNSVISIGTSAFYGCSSLASITIPSDVTSIGFQAFYGCSSLASVTIPISVTNIGYQAFYGCSKLTIYTETTAKLNENEWNSAWNYSRRPVIRGCVVGLDNVSSGKGQPYVISFTKSGAIENANGNTLIAPYRAGYTFGGWYENSSFTGVSYSADEIKGAPNGVYYAKWTVESGSTTAHGGQSVAKLPNAGYCIIKKD